MRAIDATAAAVSRHSDRALRTRGRVRGCGRSPSTSASPPTSIARSPSSWTMRSSRGRPAGRRRHAPDLTGSPFVWSTPRSQPSERVDVADEGARSVEPLQGCIPSAVALHGAGVRYWPAAHPRRSGGGPRGRAISTLLGPGTSKVRLPQGDLHAQDCFSRRQLPLVPTTTALLPSESDTAETVFVDASRQRTTMARLHPPATRTTSGDPQRGPVQVAGYGLLLAKDDVITVACGADLLEPRGARRQEVRAGIKRVGTALAASTLRPA
jgi:hypothetical protein